MSADKLCIVCYVTTSEQLGGYLNRVERQINEWGGMSAIKFNVGSAAQYKLLVGGYNAYFGTKNITWQESTPSEIYPQTVRAIITTSLATSTLAEAKNLPIPSDELD
jgi:hypothetical protein